MIRYDFKCEECGAIFEVQRRSYQDKKKLKCPKCKTLKIRKIIGVTPVIYKSEGFTLANKSE